MSAVPSDDAWSQTKAVRLEGTCTRFEAAWKAGQGPRIEDFLDDVPQEDRSEVLRELLAVELQWRQSRKEEPTRDEYLGRFPGHDDDIEAAFGLAFRSSAAETIDAATDGLQARRATLRVRCPQCRHPIEIGDETSLTEIVCPSCDVAFSLVGRATPGFPLVAGGRTIANFELIEQVGVGAFGAVWRAYDRQLDRTVAVKVPRKGQLSLEETEKFLREARAAAQLQHPNIISVHEVGLEGETVYVAFLRTPNDAYFYQGFLQVDVPLNGNSVLLPTLGTSLGRLNEQTLLLRRLADRTLALPQQVRELAYGSGRSCGVPLYDNTSGRR